MVFSKLRGNCDEKQLGEAIEEDAPQALEASGERGRNLPCDALFLPVEKLIRASPRQPSVLTSSAAPLHLPPYVPGIVMR